MGGFARADAGMAGAVGSADGLGSSEGDVLESGRIHERGNLYRQDNARRCLGLPLRAPPSRGASQRQPSGSGWIVTLAAPGMTPRDAFHGPPTSADRAVFVDCVDRILTARGVIPALPAEKAPQRHAIK